MKEVIEFLELEIKKLDLRIFELEDIFNSGRFLNNPNGSWAGDVQRAINIKEKLREQLIKSVKLLRKNKKN